MIEAITKARSIQLTIDISGSTRASGGAEMTIKRTVWLNENSDTRRELLEELRTLCNVAQNDVDAALLLGESGSRVFPHPPHRIRRGMKKRRPPKRKAAR